MNAAPKIVPAFAEAARQATLHNRPSRNARVFALSTLYGAIEEAARFTMDVGRDERIEALARALALTIHTSSKDKADAARLAANAARAMKLCLEILDRDPTCVRSPESTNPKNAKPEEGA